MIDPYRKNPDVLTNQRVRVMLSIRLHGHIKKLIGDKTKIIPTKQKIEFMCKYFPDSTVYDWSNFRN